MTYVYLHEENGQKEIYCKGHSGYAAAGADIVCAAVSILTYSFNRLVIELDKRNKLQLNVMEIKDGETRTIISDPVNVTQEAFYMLKVGIESLEENFEKNVKIYTEWGDFLKANNID